MSDSEWRVIDANALRRGRLLKTFLEDQKNIAVVTDFCCMECYKGDPLRALPKSLSILSQHPRQVVVLKGTEEISRITAQDRVDRHDLVDWEQTGGFADFCLGVSRAVAGDKRFAVQIRSHGAEANALLGKLAHEAGSLGESINQVAAALPAGLNHRLRSRTTLTQDDLLTVIDGIAMLAKEMFGRHPELAALNLERLPFRSFVFRFSLASYLLAISWVAMGGVESALPRRLANDVVDMNYVAFATFFDGLVSNDKKVNEIYESSMLFLANAFLDEASE
jgi:hypothetical protein